MKTKKLKVKTTNKPDQSLAIKIFFPMLLECMCKSEFITENEMSSLLKAHNKHYKIKPKFDSFF